MACPYGKIAASNPLAKVAPANTIFLESAVTQEREKENGDDDD